MLATDNPLKSHNRCPKSRTICPVSVRIPGHPGHSPTVRVPTQIDDENYSPSGTVVPTQSKMLATDNPLKSHNRCPKSRTICPVSVRIPGHPGHSPTVRVPTQLDDENYSPSGTVCRERSRERSSVGNGRRERSAIRCPGAKSPRRASWRLICDLRSAILASAAAAVILPSRTFA